MSTTGLREARRKKILENSKKRMEKLQALKESESTTPNEDTHETSVVNGKGNTTNLEKEDKLTDFCEKKIKLDVSQDDIIDEDTSERKNNLPHNDGEEEKNQQEHSVSAKDHENWENSDDKSRQEQNIKNTPIYTNKKYRALIFVLLAWSLYLVVEQGFDAYLQYLITKPLNKEALNTLFVTAFCAVEFQLIFLALISSNAEKGKASMFSMVLAFVLGQSKIFQIFKKIVVCIGNVITDLSVYIFSLVLFHSLNEIYSQ